MYEGLPQSSAVGDGFPVPNADIVVNSSGGNSTTGAETSPLRDGQGGGRGAVAAPTGVGPSNRRSRIERPALGQIVAYYKYETTKRINQLRDMAGVPVWQRNYWEHIIRHQESLDRIREYIENNPARWAEDQLHPDASPNPFNRWPSP